MEKTTWTKEVSGIFSKILANFLKIHDSRRFPMQILEDSWTLLEALSDLPFTIVVRSLFFRFVCVSFALLVQN